MALEPILLRLAAVEKDIKELKEGLGLAFAQIQAVNRMVGDHLNFLIVKSILEHKGDRDLIIENVRLLTRNTPDTEFDKFIIPMIDANIKVYEEQVKEKEE